MRRQAADREARLELDAMYQAGAVREAREEGRQEGLAEAVVRQLDSRFGPIDASMRRRVSTASAAELNLYLDRILVAEELDAVFASEG